MTRGWWWQGNSVITIPSRLGNIWGRYWFCHVSGKLTTPSLCQHHTIVILEAWENAQRGRAISYSFGFHTQGGLQIWLDNRIRGWNDLLRDHSFAIKAIKLYILPLKFCCWLLAVQRLLGEVWRNQEKEPLDQPNPIHASAGGHTSHTISSTGTEQAGSPLGESNLILCQVPNHPIRSSVMNQWNYWQKSRKSCVGLPGLGKGVRIWWRPSLLIPSPSSSDPPASPPKHPPSLLHQRPF